MTQKITPFLWFDGNAEEAAKHYVSIFKNGKITNVTRFGTNDAVMTVSFELEGQKFIALNGGPKFKFTPAFSLFVDCEDQAEIDRLWAALTADGGGEDMCGWLRDKYGMSWQIIPNCLGELLQNPGAVEAMLQMRKLDIEALRKAGSGPKDAA
jgi:predicted 3-demethylubiquinone-9 3-methyltransferase (glyoxalase superfamily)